MTNNTQRNALFLIRYDVEYIPCLFIAILGVIMQTQEDMAAELLVRKNALALHNFSVRNDLSPEELEQYKDLLLAQLAKLQPQPESVCDISDSVMESDFIDSHDVEEPDAVPRKKRNTPTVAAHINKDANAGAVYVKRVINEACPEVKLGSSHTPVKTFGRNITNAQCFFSPGGTTATYQQTSTVHLKKVSGGQFVASENSEDSENSERSYTS